MKNLNALSFDQFRRWFNARFSLSLNGKFKGLLALGDKLSLFIHKLNKMLNRRSNFMRPLGDVLLLHIGTFTIKLYNR